MVSLSLGFGSIVSGKRDHVIGWSRVFIIGVTFVGALGCGMMSDFSDFLRIRASCALGVILI